MPRSCKLTRTPNSLDFDFRGSPGKVTLKVRGTGSDIVFRKAVYNGTDLLPTPRARVIFVIAAGLSTLEVVYQFTDTVHGKGKLTEVCSDNTELIDVSADEPAVTYRISA
jgi:hypothetical protein